MTVPPSSRPYPSTTTPTMYDRINATRREYIRTGADPLDALITAAEAARDSLRTFADADDTRWTPDDQRALDAIEAALVPYALPEPLTLPEAVVALIEARNVLALTLNDGPVPWDALNATKSAVQAALDRAPMTEDDLPRP